MPSGSPEVLVQYGLACIYNCQTPYIVWLLPYMVTVLSPTQQAQMARTIGPPQVHHNSNVPLGLYNSACNLLKCFDTLCSLIVKLSLGCRCTTQVWKPTWTSQQTQVG